MRKFSQIMDLAISRHGKAEIDAVLKASVPVKESGPRSLSRYSPPLKDEALAAIPDDRWLSAATKAIFCAGFNWKVVENKWEGFEEAFEGFDLPRWVLSTDDDLAALLSDKRVVRNGAKLASVPKNARFFAGLSRENRGVGRYIAGWPVTSQSGLMSALERGGDRLGGNTGTVLPALDGQGLFHPVEGRVGSPPFRRRCRWAGHVEKGDGGGTGRLQRMAQRDGLLHDGDVARRSPVRPTAEIVCLFPIALGHN